MLSPDGSWRYEFANAFLIWGIFSLVAVGVWWVAKRVRKMTRPYPRAFFLLLVTGIGALVAGLIFTILLGPEPMY